ncbi:MAG: hypothetical protein QOK29_4151 [Rhodospirillaceae bacterium]|nr:hypothetical protein [Rhodospirillaceae bacterium]
MTATSTAPPDERFRWARRLILLAVALAGIAHIAFLPPFEGFDESAHLSYIQQIADTGRIPRLGVDRISTDVEDYPGPHVLSMQIGKQDAGRVYRIFFGKPVPDLKQPVSRAYRPGVALNWQAQHPPLYYVLMTPFYRLAENWSWPGHMLLLRLVSWAAAFAGLVIGMRATEQVLSTLIVAPAAALLVPAWPLLFPEFFPEMARLGNDSLCLLLMGFAWRSVVRGLHDPDPKTAIGLGVSLGCGLLTKAFFWPIVAGCVALFGLAWLQSRQKRFLKFVAIAVGFTLVIGGWWYIRSLLTVGSFLGGAEFVQADQVGGILARLSSGVGLDGIRVFLRGMAVIAGSFAWAGTWTLAMLPQIFTLPVVLLAALPLALWLARLRALPVVGLAPLFLAAPFLAGLLYHVLGRAVGAYDAGTPGWYLHILAAPLALAVALGWRWRRFFAALVVYGICFHLVCWATQLSLFSGCTYKPGPHMSLTLDPGSCLIVPSHLATLGEPLLGSIALAAAAVAGFAGLFLAMRPTVVATLADVQSGFARPEIPIKGSR